jgi:putative Holliday junction resolvase
MRILALDVGDVRIGVAVSDELELGAYPLVTLTRHGSLRKDVAQVAEVVVEQEADMVLVGMPTSLDGGEGNQAKRTRVFGESLSRSLRIPLTYWDESLTSVEADEQLIALDYSRDKRRRLIDQWAAKILLESYIDHRRRSRATLDAPAPPDPHEGSAHA